MLKKFQILNIFIFVAFAAELSSNERFMSDGLQLSIAYKFHVADVEAKNFTFTSRTLEHATQFITDHVSLRMEFETGSTNLQLITPGPASGPGTDLRQQTHIEFPHRQRLETRHCPTDTPKHGLVATALTAYNHHQPLALSPDDFWLLIAQGVAQHIGGDNATAETYRNMFVNHEGKKRLEIDGKLYGIHPKAATNKPGWPQAMQEFVRLIKGNTKTNISNIMYSPFSTSGPEVETAFAGTLMETMKNYFEYRMRLLCGIPKIYLLGAASDYQEIIQRIDQLKPILPDFQWYLDRVRSRMVTIAQAAEGNANTDFWNRMILEEGLGSGGQKYMTGWLPDFIPYVYAKGYRRQNRNVPLEFTNLNFPAASLTDFKLEDSMYTFKEYDMKLITGFFGPAWDVRIEALRPAIGWAIGYIAERPLS